MADEQKPTSGRQWRKPREEGYPVTLFSGNVALLRPVALDSLLISGDIPDFLTPIVGAMLFENQEPEDLFDPDNLVKETVALLNVVARASFVYPRVVDDPQDDDEIALADISAQDKGQVFALVTEPARVLAMFSEQQAQGLEPISDSEDDGEPAE